jgi:UDP-N-acetylmuramoylalanine--D-glutamate ligase
MDLDIAGCAVLVLELSSYQLDLCPTFAPDIAVHLNLTPDHIDRHGSMDGYRAAKMRIFRGPGVAIIGIDDAESRKMAADVRAQGQRQVLTLSTLDAAADLVIQGGDIVVEGRAVGDMARAWALRGAHNHQNAAAALMAVREMGVGMGAAIAALETFPGLAHRMYKVAEIGGVSYINDSKATNADAASKALGSFETIYWILGGKPKEGGLAGLEGFLPRVRHGFTIGAADEMFAQWLEARGCAVTRCGTLEKAVAAAHKAAQAEKIAGAVVLLSPACASFDQFRSFEHRGDMFTQYVTRLGAGIKAEATG